jgi:hypothetical protein
MDQSTPAGRAAATQLRGYMHTIAQLLRDGPPLGPEAQQLLAELVDELGKALEAESIPPAELNQLANHVASLVRAAQAGDEGIGMVAHLRDRLEDAAAAVESRVPLLAGLTRRLVETLSEIGI